MTGPSVDSGAIAGPVRAGEELDTEAVDRWLKALRPELRGRPRIRQFAGGASNWTYLLEYDNDELVLRRPPAGTRARSAHDLGREYRIQSALAPRFPYLPEMLGHCADESVTGAEFYVMRRLPGPVPRRELPPGYDWTPQATRSLCRNALDVLVELHRVDPRAAGLEVLCAGEGYVRRQVEGWSRRYERSRTWNVPDGRAIISWLAGRMPEAERLCVTHNDFRLDNLVLDGGDPTRVVGVLDWELAALGDPWMDLANSLAYWVEAGDDWLARATRRQPTHRPGMLTRRELFELYRERTGTEPEDWTFYEVFGRFRLSVIAQQIYFRYHHRQTRNPAFRHFWILVRYLHRRCLRSMRDDSRSGFRPAPRPA